VSNRLINFWPSVNAPFYGYSKLQLHGTEKSRNRRRSNNGDRTGDPPAQKATYQPTELRLLLKQAAVELHIAESN